MSLEVEVIGDALGAAEVERLVAAAVSEAGVADGHVAVAFVDAERIAALNAEHRGKQGPTDVLSFPVDEEGDAFGASGSYARRDLGDGFGDGEHPANLSNGEPSAARQRSGRCGDIIIAPGACSKAHVRVQTWALFCGTSNESSASCDRGKWAHRADAGGRIGARRH